MDKTLKAYLKKHKVAKTEASLLCTLLSTFSSYASLAAKWDIEDEDDYDDLIGEVHRNVKGLKGV